ncbi:flagellar hook-length control protein FliK [Bisbaumannia pacifica]|uniref:Flagellar hook-length control protein FliK n=1 Tax=Bisbaumannia pacifica TaxID=77098 RepID=A0ABD4KZM4_9GAMM|nr:flagellar hook-length control protein FliK [Halomonas pacifica]MBH8579885.1 flagellar hook-length control protein FliK [Halomonas pacifica]
MDITALLAMTAGRPGATPRSDAGDPAAAVDFAALLTRTSAPTANGAPAPLAQRPASGEAGPDLAALARALDLEPEALAKLLDDAIAALSAEGEIPEALAGLATDTHNGELSEALAGLATDTQNGELPEALATALNNGLANFAESGELPEALRPLADGLSNGQAPEALAPLLAALAERLGASAPAQATAAQPIASAQAMPQDPRLAEIAARLALVATPATSPDATRRADGGLSDEWANLAARRGEGATHAAAPERAASLSALQAGGERPVPLAPPLVAQAQLPSGEPALDPGLSRTIGIEAGLPGASQGGAAAPQAGLSQGLSQGLPQGLTAPATASLSAPVATQAWEQQLGQQLVGLAQRGGQVELHLHPAELGPLSVSLKLGDQGAQAQFLSAHAQVRQAVEQALPQLREALAEQGIQLADTSVGEQRGERHDGFLAQGESGARGDEFQGDEASVLAGDSGRQAASLAASLRGGVDLFA